MLVLYKEISADVNLAFIFAYRVARSRFNEIFVNKVPAIYV